MKRLPAQVTNLTLFAVLLLAFATGAGAVATGTSRGRWVVIAHGIAGIMLILLIPWKGRVVRAGLRRARAGRWASVVLAVLVLLTVAFGVGYSTGLLRSVAGIAGMWLHVALALALVPLALWHLVARRRPRQFQPSRRLLVRGGLLAAASAGIYTATAGVLALTGLPGARRRFTGSYQVPADAMPTTSWINDAVPTVDPAGYRLAVGTAEYTLDQLTARAVPVRALLDCTSGWYADQDWTAVPLATLVGERGANRSVYVHAVTGYWIRLPVEALDHLWLATGAGGAPLSPGHGFPVRLVAPGRRGFWWVKWVDRVELQTTPPWWQPPFPTH